MTYRIRSFAPLYWAIALSFILVFISPSAVVWAQDGATEASIPSLPIDPSVRMGKLDNGLTYILRRNDATEKGKANFCLVSKGGSLVEKPGEEGLAHFLEGMSLRETLHFSGHKLADFLSHNGLLGGKKVHIETTYDHTIYRISEAPTTRATFVDSLLLVLGDWAGGMLLSPASVEAERGIALSRWQGRMTPEVRFRERKISALLPQGHHYARRPPYGRKKTLEELTPDKVGAFYRKWYRPDLQAVIVVGDIDLDKVERSIKRTMGQKRGRTEDVALSEAIVQELTHPQAVVLTDPSLDRSHLAIHWISRSLAPEIKSSAASLLKDYYVRLITTMLNNRLKDLAYVAEPAFESAVSSFESYPGPATNADALKVEALLVTGSDWREAMRAIVTEVKRAVEKGFTAHEFEEARKGIIEEYGLRYAKLRETSNEHFAQQYARFFVSGGYIPGIELEQKLVAQIAEQVSLKEVNDNLQAIISQGNVSILLSLPENSSLPLLPEPYRLERAYKSDFEKTTTPYRPTFAPEKLLPSEPSSDGYLVSEETGLAYGSTRWVLSNGATVYLLPTKNSVGEVQIKAVANGGFSLSDAQKYPVAVQAIHAGIIDQLGVGGHSPLALKKFVDASSIALSTTMRYDKDIVTGKCQWEDLANLFQLMYLRMSRPEFSPKDFERVKKMELKRLRSKESLPTPESLLRDSLRHAMYPDQKVYGRSTEKDLIHFELSDFTEVYHTHFCNARRYTFFVVGDFDPVELQALIEKYIATLPSDYDKSPAPGYVPTGLPGKSSTTRVLSERSYPFGASVNLFVGNAERTPKNLLIYELISDILYQRYVHAKRTQETAPGDFALSYDIFPLPSQGSSYLSVAFHTDPSQVEALSEHVVGRIRKLALDGVEAVELNNAKAHVGERHNKGLSDNGYRINLMESLFVDNEELTEHFDEILGSISMEELDAALKSLIDHDVLLRVSVISNGSSSRQTLP